MHLEQLVLHIDIILKLIGLSIICAVTYNLTTTFGKEGAGQVAFYVCYLSSSYIVIDSFYTVMEWSREAIDKMTSFMQVMTPLIAGFAAKEVVVTSFMVLFSAEGVGGLALVLNNIGFGTLNAYVLMIFCLLYPPCIAALAVIKRESGWRRLAFAAAFQIGVAWVAAFVVYRVGLLF